VRYKARLVAQGFL